MAKHVLRTQDGKKVVIEAAKDAKVYNAPVNPPNTGTRYTTGTDLLAHKARSGNMYFYFYRWSMWEGAEESFELIDKAEAEEFLTEMAGLGEHAALTGREIETAKEYGIDIMEETA